MMTDDELARILNEILDYLPPRASPFAAPPDDGRLADVDRWLDEAVVDYYASVELERLQREEDALRAEIERRCAAALEAIRREDAGGLLYRPRPARSWLP